MSAHLRLAVRSAGTPVLLGALASAIALVGVCTSTLDGDGALQVLRGAAVLLAVGLAAAADEPLARLVDASPTPWAMRLATRLAPALAAVTAAWVAVLGWAAVHGDPPVLALTLELAALAGVATALAAGMRRWTGTPEPAVLAGPALGGLYLLSGRLPRRYGLLEGQTWGPPWEAAHLRWTGVLLAALAVLVVVLADPSTGRRPHPRSFLRRR